jgi:hypothetical protein
MPSGEKKFTKFNYYDIIGYTPHNGQLEAHKAEARFKVLCCGRRFGKTTFGAKEVEPIILQPNTIGWI